MRIRPRLAVTVRIVATSSVTVATSAAAKCQHVGVMSRITDHLSSDATARWLGVELESESPLRLTMRVRDDHTNFLGVAHGGVLFSFADVAMALASNAEQTAVAIDAHMSFTARTTPGDHLTAHIEEVSASRRIATYRCTVSGPAGTVASFSGTVYRPG